MIHPPLFLSKKLFDTRIFETQTCSPTNFFGTVRPKLWQKIVIHPLFSYLWKISIPDVFWNKRGFPHKIFWYRETKTLTKNRDTPPFTPVLKIFRYPNFLKHGRAPLGILSALWETRIFDGKSWYSLPPPSLIPEKFWYESRNFLKHRSVPLRNFSTLWDKKLSTENSVIFFLCVRSFKTRFFLKHRRVLLRNFLVLWDKNWTKLVKQPLFSYPIKFSIPEMLLKHRRVSLRSFPVVRERENVWLKSW